jgi:uncharacterized protein YdeI (YjbR/CyaY-like superfamily)
MEPTSIVHFKTPAGLRRWLSRHHARKDELWVGFYKKGTGKKGVTYPEALDQALCFGWIDGLKKGVDAERYTIRFTPRRKGSHWSAFNINRVEELNALGLMALPGLKAFEERTG